MEAGTLHCPSCGAVISSDSTQCEYCSAQLQTVACASCFGLMFVGSKFCPHCGAAVAAVESGPVAPHPCPRCPGNQLQLVTVGGVQLEECLHCGGLWVGTDVFNKICADRQMQESAEHMQLPPAIPQEHKLMYLKCPQCASLMNRYNFANRSGVVIDKCAPHGIWLDRDDLRRIIEFIRSGGLAAAREVEIEQLHRERAQLEADHEEACASLYSNADPYVSGQILSGIASIGLSLLR